MRKLEKELCGAIRQGFNMRNAPKKWSKSNTILEFYEDAERGRVAKVSLHGNHIATVENKGLWIVTGGCWHWWFSRTTFSRLNALINSFGIDPTSQGVGMQKHIPYLYTWGKEKLEMSLNSKYWVHGVSLGK
tara:strand:+ start:130 stop:525 length:396 start_codon:yes stop_codon:yes gene_type:complete